MPQTVVITHAYTTQEIDQPAVDRQETVGVVTRRPGENDAAFAARVEAVVAGLRAKVWQNETGLKAALNGKPVYEGTLSHEMVEDLDAEPTPTTARDRLGRIDRFLRTIQGVAAMPLRDLVLEVGVQKTRQRQNVVRLKVELPADELLAVPMNRFDVRSFMDNGPAMRLIPVLVFVPSDSWTPDTD